jgi:hypothetical protein
MKKEEQKEIKELKKEIKKEKDIKYLVKITNLEDRGESLQFFLEGKYYDLPDGKEAKLKKEVIDHLNNIFLTETKVKTVNGEMEKERIQRNRVLCSVIEKIEE